MNTKIQSNEMLIGDRVNIIDWDEQYTTDTNWFEDNLANLRAEWLIHYRYDNYRASAKEGCEYKILYIDTSENKVLVGEIISYYGTLSGVYLFDSNGIEVRESEKREYYFPIKVILPEDDVITVKMTRSSDNKECFFSLNLNEYKNSVIDLSNKEWR